MHYIEENTFARSWNQTHDLRISETKGYVLSNWATNTSRRKRLTCDSDQTWVFLWDRDSQIGKIKALTLLNNIVSILLKYLSIIFQKLAFGSADPQIVGSIPAAGESVF